MYLEKVNSPNDIKDFSIAELVSLSGEVRQVLLKKLSETGGHIGSNFGMVEATIAIHYVFNSPVDKIVFDVSHQSATHKLLTGRKNAFMNPEEYKAVSTYTNPNESKHDFFTVGHTSTSISLACGLAKARDLNGGRENIITVIGDGSLSGGEAYEGLNNASEASTNMIIVVNDNEMSVSENHGGIYKNLKHLRDTEGKADTNFFKAMGFDYVYVSDGHNIAQLVDTFNQVKDSEHPVVVHIHTVKGKGFAPAEQNKEAWHYRFPFNIETGEFKCSSEDEENYSNITAEYLLEKMKKDITVTAITSGTPEIIAFNPQRRKEAGKQFVDVGIAEEHAVAMASGMAEYGAKPVYAVVSSFIQRTYDQLSQDLCINKNAAVILVFHGGVFSFSDITHLGFFDIPVISNIPNMVYLAPSCKEEYLAMLEWGIRQNQHPVAIRVPGMGVVEVGIEVEAEFSELNRYQIKEKGKEVAIIALGSFYPLGQQVKTRLKEKTAIDATLINPRYITGIDKEMLKSLKEKHKLVITLEEGVLDGGFGEKIARFYGNSDMKVMNFGLKKEFIDRVAPEEILLCNHLTDDRIVEDIISLLDKKLNK
jgi:1-deoxy-D-xylulose-5-phosphate synthase